jgi:protein TonB
MKLHRLHVGLIFLVLAAGDAMAANAEPVRQEVAFTGSYVRGHKGLQMPRMIKSVPPKYPVEFRDARIEGMAIVEFIISTKGVPEEVQYSSATDQAFGKAACAAVRKWRYEPAMEGGKPVRNRVIQRIDFRRN